VLGGG
jgi:hypothetical protein